MKFCWLLEYPCFGGSTFYLKSLGTDTAEAWQAMQFATSEEAGLFAIENGIADAYVVREHGFYD